jgi:hypothetical protein
MKPVRIISTILGTSAMFLLFYVSTPVLRAQEEHPEDAKPAEPHDQGAKPSEEGKPPHDEAKPSEAKPPKDEKAPPADNKARPDERTETRTQTETKTTVKHGPIENGRIPDAQFHAHFGRAHTCHVGHPQMVAGQYRFNYGGYWFSYGVPWPVGWGYDDEFYVDFIDGQYYLIDLAHPQVRLALIVVV